MADGTARQGELFGDASAPDDVVQVSGRCVLRTQDGHRLVVAAGVPLAHFAVGDRMSEALAIVSVVEQGWATQSEAARGFGVSTRSVRRFQRRFAQGGLEALARHGGYPAGRPRLTPARTRLVERLRSDGKSHREIATRIGVTEKAVRNLLRRLGWKEPVPEKGQLPFTPAAGADPNLSASPTPTPPIAASPADREPDAPPAAPPPQAAQVLDCRPDPVPGSATRTADPNLSAHATDEEPLPVSLPPGTVPKNSITCLRGRSPKTQSLDALTGAIAGVATRGRTGAEARRRIGHRGPRHVACDTGYHRASGRILWGLCADANAQRRRR